MMRSKTLYLFLLGLLSASMAWAADPANGSAKATFVKDVPLVAGAQKLLGGNGQYLFFATKEGAVAEVDGEGKLLRVLQAKDGGDLVLKKPEMVALGGNTLYVADSEQGQIVMFSTDGKYEGSFGAKKGGFFSSGGGEHELKKTRGVAFHDGVVYALDNGQKRVLMFGSNGVYLGVLELRPAAKTAKGQAETFRLREPIDIKLDVMGRVYILDAEDSLVKCYSADGEFLHAIPWEGELIAMAVANDGIYTVKNHDFTIQKYDFNDKLLYRFGATGAERGQFKTISGLVVTPERQVLVADSAKGTLDYFDADASLAMDVIPRVTPRPFVQSLGEIATPANKMVWNGKDTLYALDTDQRSISLIRNGKVEATLKDKEIVPVAVAADATGALWVLEKKYRVSKLDSTGKVLFRFGSEGSKEGQFSDPIDMAISASGKIYVADKGNRSVQIFDTEGKLLSAIPRLESPSAIAVDNKENVYILEREKRMVSIYSPQGAPMGSIGSEREGNPAYFSKPLALMVTFDELMVVDGSRVKVFSLKGEYLRSFAANGKRRGELDTPVAIIPKDDAMFFIADQGGKRIQTFITQYKPRAPQKLMAEDGLHKVTLKWEALEAPYVKQYQVYRSKEEQTGFVRVATVEGNQYVDRGLEADGKYFYRVAAETKSGFEGATSGVVLGLSKRYTPPALEKVDVVVSEWQIKLSWKPIESEFLSSYIIYQKEGSSFTKVAEVVTPEFVKDGLKPSTQYTYYVAAHSSDGTDAEKTEVTATTLAFSKAPLDVEVVKLQPIFSNTYKLYETEGIGLVKLTNYTASPMEGITFAFKVNEFMDFPTESKIDKLLPGQSVEIKLKAVFNNHILNVTEDSSVQTLLEASHFVNGKRESYSKSVTISVYEKHKLMWDERERYASFITPKDPPVINFVRSIVTQYKETKDETQLAAALFNALGVYGLTYIPDPTNPYQVTSGKTDTVDYIQFPRETLERRSGDCDDLVAFYTSALDSMGIATRVVEVPGHMFMMFSTGVAAEEDGYNMDDMYVIYEGKLWVPVETTVVGNSFVKAWELGAKAYYQWKDKGLTILDVQKAWETFKPASLAESRAKTPEVTREVVEKKFPNEVASMLKISSQTKTRHYRQDIEKNPQDVDAHLQIGIILAKLGDREEAMKYFDKALALQPYNAAALNNRGNLFMIDDKYAEAQAAYREAARVTPDDPYIWINLAKAYKATNKIQEAKEAFLKAQNLDVSIKKKFKALGLELTNTL